MNITVVVPVLNEADNISDLEKEIRYSLNKLGVIWECIWVDDASTDNTWQEILELAPPNRGIRLRNNYGQTTATMVGVDYCNYEYVVTIDGDSQNNPADIIKMFDLMKNNPTIDLVQGYRINRRDNFFSRKMLSKIANLLIRKVSGHEIIDLGCSLRLFKRDVITDLKLTGEMHRLFALYLLDNGAKIMQTSVTHRPRLKGQSKYGLGRIFKLVMDILLYKTIKKIFINPLYTFGKLASFGFVFSFSLFIAAVLLRIMNIKKYFDGSLISTSVIIFATSSIFIGLGLIGEMIIRYMSNDSGSARYSIASKHN